MEMQFVIFSDDMAHELIKGRKTSARIITDKVFEPGELLWVKEAYVGPYLPPGTEEDFEANPTKYLSPDYCRYKSLGETNVFKYVGYDTIEAGWFPKENMPIWASQTTLKIRRFEKQRLQAITDHKALSEGVRWTNIDSGFGEVKPVLRYYMGDPQYLFETPRGAFAAWWQRTYFNWDDDPIVAVIEFEVIRENIKTVI